MSAPLAIKGIGEGLLITLPEGPWEEVVTSVLRAIDERGEFLHGAKVAVQLDDRAVGAAELGRLRDDLAERQVNLWAVLGSVASTRSAAADLGLELALDRPEPRREADGAAEAEVESEDAVLVRRTLRSGQSLRFPGHVIVLGDVNPGAEIVAGGDIIVWGRLRGVAHAGAAGDEAAVVCALDLSPTQLRIAGQIAVSPDRRGKAGPEMARIREGQLVAERWSDERHR